MKSTIKNIKEKIINKHKVSEDHFDEIISIYCKEVKLALRGLEKPEIAVLWGTLYPSVVSMEKYIAMLNKIVRNYDSGEVVRLEEGKIQEIKEEIIKLKRLISDHRKAKYAGKIEKKKKQFR